MAGEARQVETVADLTQYSPTEIQGIRLTGEPVITGSVHDLYPALFKGDTPVLAAQATDHFSVFDIGRCGFIGEGDGRPGTGALRTAIRHDIYSLLQNRKTWEGLTEPVLAAEVGEAQAALLSASPYARQAREWRGAPTHHLGIVDPLTGKLVAGPRKGMLSDTVVVKRFGTHGDNYTAFREAVDSHQPVMVPLEVIVRAANPGGSSLQAEYSRLAAIGTDEAKVALAGLAARYGFEPPLQPWATLPHLTVDYTTKHEPGGDRPLQPDEAATIVGSAARLERIETAAMLCSAAVKKYFAGMGLEAGDFKWELAIDELHDIVAADTMDPDSARIYAKVPTQTGAPGTLHIHFGKQAIREYFNILHPAFMARLRHVRQRSRLHGETRTWQQIYMEELPPDWKPTSDGYLPGMPRLSIWFNNIMRRKYEYMAKGVNDPAELRAIAKAESEFYLRQGGAYALGEFFKRNLVPA